MNDRGKLSRQEMECFEMYQLYDSGAHELALLKTHIKKWEYVIYGGRPEVYPQDRLAILTLLKFKNDRIQRENRRMETEQRIKDKMRAMRRGT